MMAFTATTIVLTWACLSHWPSGPMALQSTVVRKTSELQAYMLNSQICCATVLDSMLGSMHSAWFKLCETTRIRQKSETLCQAKAENDLSTVWLQLLLSKGIVMQASVLRIRTLVTTITKSLRSHHFLSTTPWLLKERSSEQHRSSHAVSQK